MRKVRNLAAQHGTAFGYHLPMNTSLAPAQSDQVLVEGVVVEKQATVFIDRSVAAAMTSPLGTILLATVEAQVNGWGRALLWLGLINLVELLIIGIGWRYRRARPASEDALPWARGMALASTLAGIAWGFSVWFFWVDGQYLYYLLNLTILAGVAALCVFVMSPFLPAMAGFTAGILMPPILHLALVDNPHAAAIFMGLAFLFVLVLQYARLSKGQLVEGLESAARSELLAGRLALRTLALEASQAELNRANAALERRVAERTAQLEMSNRELESFSYSVSHDLRAPLRAVTGFSRILLEQEGSNLSSEGRRYLGIIDANGQRMGSLVDALLALGRYSRVALDKAPLDMTALAREACAELAASHPVAQVRVDELPEAMGNATLLKQVFLNLLANALKFTAHEAVPRITVSAEGGTYSVKDNGVGFDMAYAEKLFKPFERLHSEREFSGTGIGLAIVKLVVERHGGRVWAESAPGQGATFRFTLG